MENLFFVLDTVYASDIRYFAGGQVMFEDEKRCPQCNSILPNMNETIKIALNHIGKQGFAEFLWNSHSYPIFRDDLIDEWFSSGLTGFTTKPVEIIGWFEKSKKPLPENIPSYKQIITTSNVELIEPEPIGKKCSRCGFIKYAFPKLGNHLPEGLRIKIDTWNGNDLFGLQGYQYTFCSSRVLEVTLQKKYKHISFINTANWNKWKSYDARIWTPDTHKAYVDEYLIRNYKDLEKCSD